MSSCFASVEEAKGYALAMLGLDEEEGFSLEEVDPLPVGTFGADLLVEKAESDDATDSDRAIAESIESTTSAQRTFKFMNNGEEHEFELREPFDGNDTAKFNITIGPFRSGFDCWLVAPKGMAQRL